MSVRKVVTAAGLSGSESVVVDEEVVPIGHRAGVAIHRLWGTDDVPMLSLPPSPMPESFFPRPGGARAVLITLAPDDGGNDAAFHATNTVDVAVVIAGRLTLEVEGGATVELGPGESLIQHGTRHRWRNAGTEVASMAVFVMGAEPKPRSEV